MTEIDTPSFAYLPVPEIVSRLGLYVTGAGTDIVPAGAEYPRQSHPELYDFSWVAGRILPEFQILFISEGAGEFESKETGLVNLTSGSFVFLFPDIWHRYRPSAESGWTEYWISLGGDLLFQWRQRGLFSPDRAVAKITQPERIIKHYRDIINFVVQHPEQDAPILTAGAMAIIASALEQSQTLGQLGGSADLENRSTDPLVTSALRIIWNNSHQRVSVEMIAKHVGVTRRTLERHFKNQLGRTVLQELVACRVQRAKRLLCETHVPVKYVAYAAGFSSISNLCKVFRREVGMTPGDYRANKTRG